MNKHSILKLTIGAAVVASLMATTAVFAEDGGVNADASVQVNVGTTSPIPPRGMIRREGEDAARMIRGTATTTRRDIIETMHSDVKDIRNASGTPEQKRGDVMDARIQGRVDLMQNHEVKVEALRENMASTTAAIKERRAEIEGNLKLKKGEKRQKLEAKAQANVQTLLTKIFSDYEARLTQLTNVDAKIAARINTLSAAGTDVSVSAGLLVTAQAALSQAKTDEAAAKATATDQANASTTKDVIRSIVTTAQTSLQTAVQAYRKVAESLPRQTEVEGSASAGATTTQ